MPFKTFTDGSVFTARDVNTFMMNQQVMVFANAAARDAALLDPEHGMVAFIKDRDRLTFYNGSFWRFI